MKENLVKFKKKKGKALHDAKGLTMSGVVIYESAMREVSVIAVDDGGMYAMVRRSGCYPYVALMSDLYER